jgi:hypothetical protein
MSIIIDLFAHLRDNLAAALVKPDPLEVEGRPSIRRFVAIRTGYQMTELANGKAERPGRRHVFADVPSFAGFVLKHYTDGAAVEVLADTDRIVAIDRAGWYRDEVACVLTKHPDLAKWETAFVGAIGQKALVRFLQRMAPTLDPSQGLLGAVQNFDVSGTTERSSKVNDNGVIEIKGQRTTTQMNVKLPASFTVRTPIYLDGPLVDIVVGLGIDIDSAEPSFTLTPRNLEMAKLEAYRAEVSALRGLLGDGYLVGAGKLALES